MATLPTFRTWVAGEVVTAAYMNSNIRDGGNFFIAPPIAELRQTIAQSLANSTFAAILFDTEDIDSDGGHSTVTNTSRYTPRTAGWFQFSGGVSYAPNVTGSRAADWAQNGTLLNGSESISPATLAGLNSGPAARTKHILANGSTDYVELDAYQSSGGALNTAVATIAQSSMSVRWVHT